MCFRHQGKLEAMQICNTKTQSKIAMQKMQAKNAIHCKIPMQKRHVKTQYTARMQFKTAIH
jgi:hypothetical protein